MIQRVCFKKMWFAQVCGLCLFPLIEVAYSQGSTSMADLEAEKYRLERDVGRLSEKIEETEFARASETKRYNTLVNRYQKAFTFKKRELKDLAQEIKKISKGISQEKNKQAGIRIEQEQIAAQRKSWRKLLLEKCEELEKLVALSLPWEKEQRLDRVKVLRREIANRATSVEEGFARLMSLYQGEVKFGDEVVLHARPIQRVDGSLVNARLLRLGNQGMMYVDEEEKYYGVLQKNNKGAKYQWKEDLSFEEREAVRRAIAVKLSKKPPQIVSIPFSLTLLTSK